VLKERLESFRSELISMVDPDHTGVIQSIEPTLIPLTPCKRGRNKKLGRTAVLLYAACGSHHNAFKDAGRCKECRVGCGHTYLLDQVDAGSFMFNFLKLQSSRLPTMCSGETISRLKFLLQPSTPHRHPRYLSDNMNNMSFLTVQPITDGRPYTNPGC
jgi:hypothetical protein